jgi:putative heme-binding domain-containing protein
LVVPGRAQEPPKSGSVQAATPVEKIKIAKDFKVELLYSVPKEKEGSWVSMCVDPKGRLIVCDQYGGLYRITPGADAAATKIEKLTVDIGDAQGLLYAFDSLYVVVNSNRIPAGLYRVRDTNNDDQFDEVKLLRKFTGHNNGGLGEHGPHAVLLTPDNKSLVVVCGNQTKITELTTSRVPRIWGEDHLLPRMPDGKGFMANVLGPGGAMYKVDPDGKEWELLSVGYRNQYDAAFNKNGDLFTYDADMEWDFNTPWYRPTRVCLSASGSEFGWRNGAGKWPSYYPDSLPSIVDIGPGSPTGVTFGYGAKFPAKYEQAFFICDWSYGKMYAVHLKPAGSAYQAELEEFISGNPLPLTDLVINPKDGAMYFAIGGRKTQSGLYRVTYAGKESKDQPGGKEGESVELRGLRRKLEAFHGQADPKAVETVWPHLGHADRYIRFAARVALEFNDPKTWRGKALEEKSPQAAITALLALVRVSGSDPFHRAADAPPIDEKLKGDILAALDKIAWNDLSTDQQIDLLRVYGLVFNRLGKPNEEMSKRAVARLDPLYPAKDRYVNGELCQVLVYLEAPKVAERTLKLLEQAPTQEEQIDYTKSLRMLKSGWTLEQRKQYFSWFLKAGTFKGGASFELFMANIKKDAVATLSDGDKVALKDILEAKPITDPTMVNPPRPFVKKWTLDELTPLVEKGLKKRDYDRGRSLFGAANCYACHRFGNEGGANGPDLTGSAGRFSVRDLLESIVDPSKVVSDQYAAVVVTLTDGKTVTGRIVNLNQDNIMINTDMLNPNAQTTVDRKKVDSMEPAKQSMMPTGLLDTLKEEEVLDLMAFLLSRGNRKNEMFK